MNVEDSAYFRQWRPSTGQQVEVAILNMPYDGEGFPDPASNEDNARWRTRRLRQFMIMKLRISRRVACCTKPLGDAAK